VLEGLDRRYVLVHQAGHQPEVLAHLLHLAGIAGHFRREGFEGDLDAAGFVEAAEHHAHPALTEFAQDAVAAENPVPYPVAFPLRLCAARGEIADRANVLPAGVRRGGTNTVLRVAACHGAHPDGVQRNAKTVRWEG
jgi:hypothetical protein